MKFKQLLLDLYEEQEPDLPHQNKTGIMDSYYVDACVNPGEIYSLRILNRGKIDRLESQIPARFTL